MNTTVPQGKTTKKPSPGTKAPQKGSDYVVATPSHEDNSLSIIMSVTHTTLEY